MVAPDIKPAMITKTEDGNAVKEEDGHGTEVVEPNNANEVITLSTHSTYTSHSLLTHMHMHGHSEGKQNK